jgi:hypothetical protein
MDTCVSQRGKMVIQSGRTARTIHMESDASREGSGGDIARPRHGTVQWLGGSD